MVHFIILLDEFSDTGEDIVSSDGNCIPHCKLPHLCAYSIPLKLVHMVTFILIVVYYRNLSPLLSSVILMLWFAIPNDDLYAMLYCYLCHHIVTALIHSCYVLSLYFGLMITDCFQQFIKLTIIIILLMIKCLLK